MDIGQTTAIPPATTPAAAEQASQNISSDFETFLRMLTVQMQNQDPLNPVDSTDYATQLATFSGVEQAVLTNDLLKTLTAQLGSSGLADMAAWVGKEARAAAPVYFNGQPITLTPNPDRFAETAQLVVTDDNGAEVQRIAIPVTGDALEWAGVADGGFPLPAGSYAFKVESISNGQVTASEPVEVYSTVTEVRVENGQTMLILAGGVAVSSGDVTALRDPAL